MHPVELLGAVEASDPVADEAAYKLIWLEQCAELSPFAMSVVGGALADRFAWVFIAGYQGAIRHIFPEEKFTGWAAFAVSEDRSENDPLPGVTWQASKDGPVINGSKTWVAASANCDEIIISAGRGGGKQFFAVSSDHPNVEIETRPAGRMLPDLSQGSAHFSDTRLVSGSELDTRLVPGFGPCEVLYIYSAFLASTWQRFPGERADVELLLEMASKISSRDEVSREHSDMVEFDRGVQSLLRHLREDVCGDIDLWRRDYKLIAMYAQK
ncbi:MAG: hypothetical protein GKR90_11675 [Pseudomonadales bacterium]|nr:hypothetical protein [Pseudomonadales bacterium]